VRRTQETSFVLEEEGGMNELALFAGAGIMKPFIQEASWKVSDAASAVTICRYLTSTDVLTQSRITRPARSVNGQWQRTGMNATRTRQQQKSRNGDSGILMQLSNIDQTTGKSIIGKNLCGSTALSLHGLMSSYNAKATPVYVANGNFNGAISRPRLMSIIAINRKRFAVFCATVVTPSLGFAMTTTNCYLL
jgi:hypothetical protein